MGFFHRIAGKALEEDVSITGNQVKSYVERHQAEMGGDGLLNPNAVAEVAHKRGLHKPSMRTVVDAIASDISQFFREEYRTNGDASAVQ